MSPADQKPRQPLRGAQFTLGSMLLVSLVCGMTAAGARYLGETLTSDTASARALFAISVMLLPMLALVAANGLQIGLQFYQRRLRRKQRADGGS